MYYLINYYDAELDRVEERWTNYEGLSFLRSDPDVTIISIKESEEN